MHPEFLFGWFNTFNLTDIASGSSVPQLNKQDLSPLEVHLPPLILQEQYANRIRALLQPTLAANRSARSLGRLFEVLQHRAFRGEI